MEELAQRDRLKKSKIRTLNIYETKSKHALPIVRTNVFTSVIFTFYLPIALSSSAIAL